MKVRKLHLLEDSIYSDWYITNCLQCNIDEVENHFVCITDKLINCKDSLIKVISENSTEYKELLVKANQNYFKTVYINFLNYTKSVFLNKITTTHPTLVWIIWSGDLYALKAFNFKVFDKYSMQFANKGDGITLKQYIGRLKLKYIDKSDFKTKQDKQNAIYKAIRKISACATFMSQEVKFIEDVLKQKLEHIPFAIISIKNELAIRTSIHKHSVLVGNSADPSNNHFEILKNLGKLKIPDEIIIPLSYGNFDYRDKLKSDIANFGLNINSLDILLSKEDYYTMLSTVKVAVFGHNIQKAFGNIIALLFFGAKVFLKEKNPIYYELTKMGVKIYSIDKDFSEQNICSPLDPVVALENTKILEDSFSQLMILKYYRNLLLK